MIFYILLGCIAILVVVAHRANNDNDADYFLGALFLGLLTTLFALFAAFFPTQKVQSVDALTGPTTVYSNTGNSGNTIVYQTKSGNHALDTSNTYDSDVRFVKGDTVTKICGSARWWLSPFHDGSCHYIVKTENLTFP